MSPSIADMPWDAPIAQVPGQVPGGTPEMAATSLQESQTATQKELAEHYLNYGQRTMEHGQNIFSLKNSIKNADDSVLGMPRGPWAPGGAALGGAAPFGFQATDATRQWLMQQGITDQGKSQQLLNQGAELDAQFKKAQTSYLKLQELRGRFSSGGPKGSEEATPARALPFAASALGNRSMTKGQLLSTVSPVEDEMWQAMKDVVDHSSASGITADDVVKAWNNTGYSPNQIKQGLATGRSPAAETGAGGVPSLNKPRHIGPAQGPHSGVDVDQEGTKPPPRGQAIQAGVGPQTSNDITNRDNMEPMQPGNEMPKPPAGLPSWRKAQWDRAVQTLFQYPGEVAEFNKRFDPLNAGLGQKILQKYRPRGFDQ